MTIDGAYQNITRTATVEQKATINPCLKKLIDVIPICQRVFPFDSMPAVSDLEKCLAYFPGEKMRVSDPVGKKLEKGDGLYEAIKEKRIISNIVPKDIFGFPFRSISIPVFDEENKELVIGAIGFAYSLEMQFALQEMAQNISSSTEELNAVAEEFAANASDLAEKMSTLSNSGVSMMENLQKTDDILEFIESLSDRTKLLGLNALIEAARAGEHGRSFSVVAQEIQKMSDSSAHSVKTIKDMLDNMQKDIKVVINLIKESKEISVQQSAGSIEISKSLESLSKITETLSGISLEL
jgi:hypothetical protein